jgi:beta-phosphoglucomutase-like phosphatase (HAD superfamily)
MLGSRTPLSLIACASWSREPVAPSLTTSSRLPTVFTYSAAISEELAARVEAEMSQQELAALPTARPTAYVHDVVTSCRDSGRAVAVASNNSRRAVHAYLEVHGLADRVDLVVARTTHDPAQLNPSSRLIHPAMAELRAQPDECVLVGHSIPTSKPGRQPGPAPSATPTGPAYTIVWPQPERPQSSQASPIWWFGSEPSHCRINPH